MRQYNCIVVEDEPLAADVLEDYIAAVPFLKLKAIYPDAVMALDGIRESNIDVIFLDINLPKLMGLEFIKTLKNPPHIIITTAYHEYALEGYELNVIDYLLKPIEFTRFLKAVNKLKSSVSDKDRSAPVQTSDEPDFIFVNTHRKKMKLFFKDIIYVESLKEYVRIHLPDKSLTVKFQIGQLEELLPQTEFLRIHRSYLISRSKIISYSHTHIEIGGKTLPIGRSYKELAINFITRDIA